MEHKVDCQIPCDHRHHHPHPVTICAAPARLIHVQLVTSELFFTYLLLGPAVVENNNYHIVKMLLLCWGGSRILGKRGPVESVESHSEKAKCLILQFANNKSLPFSE